MFLGLDRRRLPSTSPFLSMSSSFFKKRLSPIKPGDPIDYKDVFVTMYHNMGIDIVNTPVPEMNGRPNYLYAGHEPIRELV